MDAVSAGMTPEIRRWRDGVIGTRLEVFERFRQAVADGATADASRWWRSWVALGFRLRQEEAARMGPEPSPIMQLPPSPAVERETDARFREAWMDESLTVRQVARHFQRAETWAYRNARRLGLPWRPYRRRRAA